MRKILLLVLATLLLAACDPPNPYEGPQPATPGREVVAFGDSITKAAIPHARIVNAGLKYPATISWNAENGYTISDHRSVIDYVGFAVPDVVVIALGTNDARDGVNATDAADVDGALAALHDAPCIIWVNVRSEILDLNGQSYAAWNTMLATKVRGPGRRIGDWDTWSNGHPEWIVQPSETDPRAVHMTQAGSEAYARWIIREMVTGC